MIIPAITELEFAEVKRIVTLLEKQTDLVHIDIADGVLVNGKTFLDVEKLNDLSYSCKLELHLMVKNPKDYVKPIKNLTRIIAHIEAEEVDEFIKASKDLVMKIGLTINPNTDPILLEKYLDEVDFVQFMMVEPGAQGRKFQDSVLKKIVMFKQEHPEISVQTDGGTNLENIQKLIDAGVNDIVVGSAIVKSENPVETLKKFREKITL